MDSTLDNFRDVLRRWELSHPIKFRMTVVILTVLLGAVISYGGLTLMSLSTSETPTSPQATVSFSQEPSSDISFNVTVHAESMDRADTITARVANSPDSTVTLGSVGDRANLTNVRAGEHIIVTASYNGTTTVVQTYEVVR